jgi:enediyne biosynthesis protein E4
VVLLTTVTLGAQGCRRHEPAQSGSAAASTEPSAAPAPGEWFREAAEQRGIRFVHRSSASDHYAMPEEMGSGPALFDYDNDGRLDVLLIQNAGPNSNATNQLFHQEPDGRFRDVSAGSGLDIAAYGMGVAVGDVNNDGLPDVLLTSYGGGTRLFLNRGNGKFEDVTREAGLEVPGWSVSAAFCDLDGDSWLDLVVVQYVAYSESSRWKELSGPPEYPPPSLFQGSSTRVYRNRGRPFSPCPGTPGEGQGGGPPQTQIANRKSQIQPPPQPSPGVPGEGADRGIPRFEDLSFSSGIGRVAGPGMEVVCADFNGDGWPDVLVTNDGAPNRLWINQHDFTFRDDAAISGIALNVNGVPQANMGIAIADLAGDGLLDAYVTHLTEESNVLWKQGPAGMFEDRTTAFGLGSPAWRATGFGTVFADFENKGGPDLAVVNGRVRRARIDVPPGSSHWDPYLERNQLFRNEGGGRFRDVSAANPSFCSMTNVGRGLVCGDIDNDGGVDLLVTAIDAPARLYHNVAPRRGRWLIVRAVDPAHGGRDVYGAHVVLRAGGAARHGWVNPGYSYAGSNDPRVHFGLGDADRADGIDVTWPDGRRETERFDGGAVDRILVLARGSGRAAGK